MSIGLAVPAASLKAADAPSAQKDAAPAMSPEEEEAMNAEVAYISALVNANFPDIAAPVIAAARTRWPDLGPRLKVLEIQGELRLGHFDAVKKVIADIKDKTSGEFWALNLAMADAYYARGEMKDCRRIYTDFFKAVKDPPPGLKSFFIESSYKWAQILVNEKNFDEAANRYDALLRQKFEANAWCAVATDNTELLLRLASGTKDAKKKEAYLKRATKLVDQLLWKSDMGVVFGRAVSMKAHIEMMRGNVTKAQELVNDYMPQLKEIHETLTEQDPDGTRGYVRLSPMPECRYLLAEMLWAEAKDLLAKTPLDKAKVTDLLLGARVNGKRNGLGAFNHAANVYLNYPLSAWAMQAGALVDEINDVVKAKFNKDLKASMKISADQMRKVRQMQFQAAFDTFKNGEYAQALQAYSALLSKLPETDASVGAVANMAECHINLWKAEKDKAAKAYARLCADAVEGYLAERFSGLKQSMARAAGDFTLRLASKEREAGARAREQELYAIYFENFPDHYNAAQMAMSLAAQAWKAEDWDRAIRYYTIIAESYTNSTHYADSLKMLSVCNGKKGDAEAEADWLARYVQAAHRPADRIPAELNLGILQQKRGVALFQAAETNETGAADLKKAATVSTIKAVKAFTGAAKAAGDAVASKFTSKADRAKFSNMNETALYLIGDCWQRINFPEDKVSAFRARAVGAYEAYLKAYPKGKYAPQALVKIGTVYTAEKNMEASQKAFERLQSDFPDSDEAKNSVPRLAKTLIDMGLRAEGVAQYRQMLSSSGKFTPAQFLAAGDALVDARSWDTAMAAYAKAADLVKGTTNNAVGVTARSLMGRAKALFGAQRYGEAHDTLEKFIGDETLSRSTLVVDAYHMLVEVASEEGRTEKDDAQRTKYFNAAVGAIKKVRRYRPDQADQDLLDLLSGDVLVRKMEAEEAMNLKEQARETCGRAVVTFQAFLMAHEPTPEHPAESMTQQQLVNLERCYSTALPLMAKLGKEQAELVLKYGAAYAELFPDGKHKTAVQNAVNQANAEK